MPKQFASYPVSSSDLKYIRISFICTTDGIDLAGHDLEIRAGCIEVLRPGLVPGPVVSAKASGPPKSQSISWAAEQGRVRLGQNSGPASPFPQPLPSPYADPNGASGDLEQAETVAAKQDREGEAPTTTRPPPLPHGPTPVCLEACGDCGRRPNKGRANLDPHPPLLLIPNLYIMIFGQSPLECGPSSEGCFSSFPFILMG